MAFHRFDLYPPELQFIARFARTIGHPERLHILEMLRTSGEMTVTDIQAKSPLTLPTVSQHIGILRRGGLLQMRLEGTFIWYSVDIGSLTRETLKLRQYLSQFYSEHWAQHTLSRVS